MNGYIIAAIIVLPVLFSPAVALAGKQEARDFWTGSSVLGAAGVITPEPITTAAGAGALIGQGVGFIGMGIWDAFAAAPANPDPNHGLVASVAPVTFTPVTGSGQAFDDINASIILAGEIIDDSRLLGISLERFFGAVNDGNLANAAFQQSAASQYLFGLEADLFDYRSSLVAISADISGTNFAGLSTTVADVLDLRNEILVSGFPSFEDFVFAEMNATIEEMTNAILEVSLVTGNNITDADLTGAVIFDGLASAIGEIDIRELLPVGFSTVPEPTTITLILLGLAGIALPLKRKKQFSFSPSSI